MVRIRRLEEAYKENAWHSGQGLRADAHLWVKFHSDFFIEVSLTCNTILVSVYNVMIHCLHITVSLTDQLI